MKKIFLLISLLLIFALASCNNHATKEEENDAKRVMENIATPAGSVLEALDEEDSVASKTDSILTGKDSIKMSEKK